MKWQDAASRLFPQGHDIRADGAFLAGTGRSGDVDFEVSGSTQHTEIGVDLEMVEHCELPPDLVRGSDPVPPQDEHLPIGVHFQNDVEPPARQLLYPDTLRRAPVLPEK